jgi:hypothetical protein
LVHIFINRVDSIKIILDINKDSSYLLINVDQLGIDNTYILFGLLAFFEDMVVAFVFLEL